MLSLGIFVTPDWNSAMKNFFTTIIMTVETKTKMAHILARHRP